MKRILSASAAVLALIACSQRLAQDAPSETQAATLLPLTCEAFAGASAQSLARTYGAENVVEQTDTDTEGESYPVTVIYPNDERRRLDIVWNDHAAKDAPASVRVSRDGSLWVGPRALSVGDTLAEVERANGRPFRLYGFGWDYDGWVSDWGGGAFGAVENGCSIQADFDAHGDYDSAVGDGSFASDDPAMRTAEPYVAAFWLEFRYDEP